MKHLIQQHDNGKLEKNTSTDREASTASDVSTLAKQQKLDFGAKHDGEGTLSGQDLKKLVTGYIIEEMKPISTVDSSSFWHIIEKIPMKSNVKLP